MSSEGGGDVRERELVPKLRFPEFRDPWSSVTMSEAYEFKGNNPLSRDQLNYEAGALRNIHYGDIHTKFASHFYVEREQVPYVNPGESHTSMRSENYCRPGDVIFADASEDMNDIGKAIEVIDAGEIPLVAGLHTILARPSADLIAPGFGGFLFQSSETRRQIQRESQGAKVLGLSPTRLSQIKISLPKDKAEQRKIAKFLSSLNDVIAAEDDRLAALKDHKMGLMQALFPAPDRTTPSLRFPQFEGSGEWMKRSLRALCSMKAGTFIAASEIEAQTANGLFPCFGGNGLRGYTRSYTHSGRFPLIGRQGALCGNVNLADGNFYATEHAIVADPKKGISANWLYYALDHLRLNRFATGQAQPGLSVETLNAVECPIAPTEVEQVQIASCLGALDCLVSKQNEHLETLKTHKAALMQQLFPAPAANA